ncbi:hypothetical protein F4802DRAFT_563360 [Xylaria palmicola]|nr:hypothetical protein F4802DRAFT_563360 [Xylaria palmicola]
MWKPNLSGELEEWFVSFFEHVSKDYLFAAENGIMGLATAPIQKDDILAIIDGHPNWVILREIKHKGNMSQAKKKHRIIARAAITESREKARDRINKGLQQSLFQII